MAHSQMTLAVTPFTNQTREPDIERLVTTALRRRILQSTSFVLLPETAGQRRLAGTVRRFRSVPISFDANDNVLEYRLEVDIVIRLFAEESRQPLLEQELSAAAEYLVSRVGTGDVREDVVAKEVALTQLAQQFADQCTTLLTVFFL